ncbi:MAG: bifunctional ADP-dependent NAD(P)H-hydrate dehydratase/NAD(P)H-hydrate epimerase [Pararhodobacter sp.]
MRAIEDAAIESGAVTGLTLMERAGAGVVESVLRRWPGLAVGVYRAVVLCGPGNNGGDGYVIARLLHERGWRVEVFALGDPARLPPDARANRERWAALGGVWPFEDPQTGATRSFRTEAPDLVVDALFGTGLTRDLPDTVRAVLAEVARLADGDVPVVAVDIPSGLCADSGRDRGAALRSALTVSFHAAKPGHYLSEGPECCGEIAVADIGLARRSPAAPSPAGRVQLVEAQDVRRLVAKPGGHKYNHGHALVLSGGMGRTGAARLAARAALRVGAGLVTLGAPGPAMMEIAGQITALMLRRVDEGKDLVALLTDRRISALCLGPGLGVERAGALLAALGEGRVQPRPTVVDADALTALGRIEAPVPPDWVLTPHMGEFARLFPDLAERLRATPGPGPAFSRLDAARMAAARAGCTVLLKGADTVIAGPDGRAAIHAAAYGRAVPWLATAGAGDVLAGLIAGLLARGKPAFDAACAGAWLHVEAARRVGPGLIAEDLSEALPAVLKDLLA